MRTRSVTLLTALLSTLFVTSAIAGNNFSLQKQPKVILQEPLETFTVGEVFVYDVFWLGVPIGEARLEVKEKVEKLGRKAFHVIASAKTNDFLSQLYPVEDEIHTWIDAENFHSLEFRKTLREGKYRADERIIYDAASKKGSYESFKNGNKKEFSIDGPVHDLLSAFYWFRLQNAKPGDVIKTRVNGEEKDWDLDIHVLNYEAKEFRGGQSYSTMLVEPKTRLKGVLYSRGRAWVHFSTDRKRVPVFLTVQTSFGPVTGVLSKISS